MKIVCIGEILVDMIGKQSTGLKQNPEFSKRPGGAPANVAVAASRLDARVEIVASVGDDEFGEFLREKMIQEDIDTLNLRQFSESKTTLAFAALDEEAKPHFSFYRGADENISKEQLNMDLDTEDILHLGSLPLTDSGTAQNILGLLESTNATVSFDPNLRGELLEPRYEKTLKEVIEHVDILAAADEEIEFFGGLEKLREKTEEIIVTRGADGAEVFTKEESCFVSSEDVKVVDTTGAGDALTGAYLAFRNQGREKALEKAVKAASISTTSKGAMSALPKLSELE
jgi:fructokinase